MSGVVAMASEPMGLVRPRRWLLATMAAATSMAGISPAVLAIGRAWLIPYLLIGAGATTALSARNIRAPSPTHAEPEEFVLAELNALILPSLFGAATLVLYGSVYWLLRLLDSIFDWQHD